MAQIGRTLGDQRLQDFRILSEVAKELELNSATIKRWLKNKKVPNVTWGRDRRGWIFIHRESVILLLQYREAVHVS